MGVVGSRLAVGVKWMKRGTFVNYPNILTPILPCIRRGRILHLYRRLAMISPTSWYIKETLLSGPIWPKVA